MLPLVSSGIVRIAGSREVSIRRVALPGIDVHLPAFLGWRVGWSWWLRARAGDRIGRRLVFHAEAEAEKITGIAAPRLTWRRNDQAVDDVLIVHHVGDDEVLVLASRIRH